MMIIIILLLFIGIIRIIVVKAYAKIDDNSGLTFYTNNTEVSIPVSNINSDMYAIIANKSDSGYLQKINTISLLAGIESFKMYVDELEDGKCQEFYLSFYEADIGQDLILPEDIIADGGEINVNCNIGEYVFKKICVVTDKTAPKIEDVQQSKNENGSIVLSVIASDNDGSGVYLYSFNDEEWSVDNYKEFNSSEEVIICVKDKVGNISDKYIYNIDSTDSSKPKIKGYVMGKGKWAFGLDGEKYYESAEIKVEAKDDITSQDELLFSVNGSEFTYSNSITINTNGEYKIIAKNNSGRESDVETVIVNIINEAPRIENVNMDTKLIEGKRYTNSEEITASFEIINNGAKYDIKNITAMFGNEKLTINNDGNNKYIVKINVNSKISVNKQLSISVTDNLNKKSNVFKENIIFDNKAPEISEICSDCQDEWCNSQITYTIKVTEEGSGLNKDSLNIDSEYIKNISFNDNKNEFSVTFDVDNGEYIDSELKIKVTDLAGNESNEKSIHLYLDKKKPVINSVNYEVVDKNGNIIIDKECLKNGDTLKISVIASDDGSKLTKDKITAYLDKSSNIEIKLKLEKNTDKAVYSTTMEINNEYLKWLSDNQCIKIDSIELYDLAGNKCEENIGINSGILYYAPFEFEKMNFYYRSSEDDLIVKDGDEIVIKFESSHEVDIKCIIGFENTDCNKWVIDKSENGYTYATTYIVKKSVENDNKFIPVYIEITDKAGNYIKPDINDKCEPILYYASIESGFLNYKVTSSNISDKQYAKNGNTITISFDTSHPVDVTEAYIAEKQLLFSSNDNMNWKAVYKIEDEDFEDNTDVSFSFTLTDAAGNEFGRTHENTSRIRYLAPIKINDLKMISNNEKAEFRGAKNGDVITVSFTANHPVSLTDTKIADRNIQFKSDDNINWVAYISVYDGIAEDMGYISLFFNVHDNAGNNVVQCTEENLISNKIQYFAPISISEIELFSNNLNDGNRYVKDGDMITVSFVSNHEIELSYINVVGNIPEISVYKGEGIQCRYELRYILKNSDIADQSSVRFSFTANDFAENEPVTIINDSVERINEIIYFAPITSDASIRSGNRNQSYVNNGGRIMISGTANHGVTPESAVIMGRRADVLGGNASKYSISYMINENEASLIEGNVTFSYTLTDLAGNTLYINSSSDKSRVIYDRMPPAIIAEYDRISFTNQSVTYKFTFSDKNISSSDISIKVNGIEQITDNERNMMSSTAFTKIISLDTDNNYHITASAKDLADNSAYPEIEERMTIDKTNPKIKTINISSDNPKVYRSSFSIRDHFEIDEKNLKEIICTVSNSNGTTDWDINTPITSDGKNTVCLMASDMADNASQAVIFDFYLDGTAPKPLVAEMFTANFLESGKEYLLKSEANLKIRLESLHIEGISEPDEFTKLYITDKNGNKIADILGDYKPESGAYNIYFNDIGKYIIFAEAKDSVGNTTGLTEYSFEIEGKSLIERFWDNKPLAAGTAAGVGVIIFTYVYVLIFKRVRKK